MACVRLAWPRWLAALVSIGLLLTLNAEVGGLSTCLDGACAGCILGCGAGLFGGGAGALTSGVGLVFRSTGAVI